MQRRALARVERNAGQELQESAHPATGLKIVYLVTGSYDPVFVVVGVSPEPEDQVESDTAEGLGVIPLPSAWRSARCVGISFDRLPVTGRPLV